MISGYILNQHDESFHLIYHLSIQVYFDSKPCRRGDFGTFREVAVDVSGKKFFFDIYTIYQIKTHFLVREYLKKKFI